MSAATRAAHRLGRFRVGIAPPRRRLPTRLGPRAATRPNRTAVVLAVVREWLPALGAVGLILYGLLRLAYVFFYLRLRTTPEEVGYGYSRILSESIAGAVELIVLCALAFAALTVLYYAARVVLRLMAKPRRSGVGAARRLAGRATGVSRWRWVVRCLAAGAAIVFASLPILAWWQGGLARNGQTVRNVYFVGVPYLPVLAVQAVPADVAWVDGDTNKPFPLANRECLLYLGEANGISVFYDVRSAESVRLPSADVTVVLRYTFFVPDMCR